MTKIPRQVKRILLELWALGQLAKSGALRPVTPAQFTAIRHALNRYGPLGAAVTIAAVRDPDGIAVIDDRGSLTFADLDARTNALANHWRNGGLRPTDGVAILARNHRGLLEAAFAAAKGGARIVMLNTDFGSRQIRDAIEREAISLLVHDDEYSDAVRGISVELGQVRAWAEQPGPDTLDAIAIHGDPAAPPKPNKPAKVVILTSGSTGVPKGAARSQPRSLIPIGGLLSKSPFRARGVTECAVPMFHALGFYHAVLAVLLGSTLIVHRRFDPKRALESVAEHRATALLVVPVMLRRILDLGAEQRDSLDLSALRIIFVSGSQLGGSFCTRAMHFFGPILYNLYGSTEVAYATIATPADLTAEPNCVGGVVRGATVKILDDATQLCPTGRVGKIYVGNVMQFDGYTGGGSKHVTHGLMASGDVGHFDAAKRLFIDGRDDEMIVSGGENVFPAEVEDTLARHPGIVEVAVLGVADEEYGQRLRSFIALRPGVHLSQQDVKNYVSEHLARFKVPRDVVFVQALPRNAAGKVLKRELDATSPAEHSI